jgi:hypothetical protein
MVEPQGAILVDSMDEDDPIDDHECVNMLDEVYTRAWPKVNRRQPCSFLEIDGRREHYIATGKFVCLRHPSISQQNVDQTVNQRCSNPLLLESSLSKANQKKLTFG